MLNRLRDLFKSFRQHDVKYVVFGGIASVLYRMPEVFKWTRWFLQKLPRDSASGPARV